MYDIPPTTIAELREYAQWGWDDWYNPDPRCGINWDVLDRDAQVMGYRDASHAIKEASALASVAPGSRALVFDNRLYINDAKTPAAVTFRAATVMCRYGKETRFGRYPDLVDVEFDHRPGEISKGHFTSMIKPIQSFGMEAS